MKLISSLIVCVLGVAFVGQSKVFTVSNNANSPGQFNDLQPACDAASENDTIYVHASSIGYSATVSKPLVIIGEGSMPNKQFSLFTKCSLTLSNLSSGSKIIGLQGIFNIGGGGYNTSNILFDKCRGAIKNNAPNMVPKNIIIKHFVGDLQIALQNAVINNSIITTLFSGVNSSSNLIYNSLILDNQFYIEGFSVKNNIFYAQDSINQNKEFRNCKIENNLFFTSKTPVILNGQNNVISVDPKFISGETGDLLLAYDYNTKNPKANFKLADDSPALKMGTDGKEIGIYGGDDPWIDGGDGAFRYHSMPTQIPHITEMEISNTSVPQNSDLKIRIKAKN